MAIKTGTMPRQIKAGKEHKPKGTTSFTPSAAARFSAARNCSRRSLAACAYRSEAEGAPVSAAKARASFRRETSGVGCVGVRQAVSQSAPMARAATTGRSDRLTGGEAHLATSSSARPIPAPASSIDATSSSIIATSLRPSKSLRPSRETSNSRRAAELPKPGVPCRADGPPERAINCLRTCDGDANHRNAATAKSATIAAGRSIMPTLGLLMTPTAWTTPGRPQSAQALLQAWLLRRCCRAGFPEGPLPRPSPAPAPRPVAMRASAPWPWGLRAPFGGLLRNLLRLQAGRQTVSVGRRVGNHLFRRYRGRLQAPSKLFVQGFFSGGNPWLQPRGSLGPESFPQLPLPLPRQVLSMLSGTTRPCCNPSGGSPLPERKRGPPIVPPKASTIHAHPAARRLIVGPKPPETGAAARLPRNGVVAPSG